MRFSLYKVIAASLFGALFSIPAVAAEIRLDQLDPAAALTSENTIAVCQDCDFDTPVVAATLDQVLDFILDNVTVSISTDVTGLGVNVATWLANPTSANLANTVTNKTGLGALVFGTSPTLNSATLANSIISNSTITNSTFNNPTINSSTQNDAILNDPTINNGILDNPVINNPTITIAGVPYTLPTRIISSPSVTIPGNVVSWISSNGLTLKDAGTPVIGHARTNAILTSMSTADFPSGVWRADFSIGRGAPPLFYLPSTTACSINGGSGDNGSEVSSSNGKCWIAQFDSPNVDVRQWGVDPAGGTGAAVQNLAGMVYAVNYSRTAKGRCALVPTGTVYINGPIAITAANACLRGVSRFHSNLVTTSTTANVVSFIGAFFNGTVSDLRLAGPGHASVTAGAAVRVGGTAANIDITRLLIEGTYDGINVNDGGVVRISHVDVAYIKRSSYKFDGTSATDYGSQNIFLSNFTAYNHGVVTTGGCIDVTAVGELHVNTGACAGHIHGYIAHPSTGFHVYNNYIENVNFDVATSHGIVVTSLGGGVIQGVRFSNMTSGLSSGSGAVLDGAATKAVVFDNFQSHRNLQHGIHIINGDGILITGSEILSNSVSAPGFHGVNLGSGTNVSIVGNRFGGWKSEGNGNTAYNVAIQSSFTGKATVSANNLCEFGTGALFNSSTSTDVLIGRDNLCLNPTSSGFVSEYGGIATIPAGTNTVTFNHAFPTTPGLVIVTGTDIAKRYAAIRTSTQITITSDSNVAVDTAVFWRGWLKP